MSRRPAPMGEYEDRRNARIRQLREQREGPMRRRRRVQPLLLVAWIAGSIALLVVLIVLGFNALFAPRVMAWVEENPGAIEHGLVQDFVKWYRPEVLEDLPASDEQRRVTVVVETGATDTLDRPAAVRRGADQQPDRLPVRGHHGGAGRDPCRRHLRPVADADARPRSSQRCRARTSARRRRSLSRRACAWRRLSRPLAPAR